MILDLAALLVTFSACGAHVVAPWALARRDPEERRPWSVLAIPLLLAAIVLGALQAAARPDALVAAGFGTYRPTDALVRALWVSLPVLLVVDLTLLAGWRKLEPMGWRLAAAFGLLACLNVAAFQELLRLGEGPWSSLPDLALASLARAVWMITAGEVLFATRPGWAIAAAAAIPLYLGALPAVVAEALLGEGWWLSAGAAFVLLAAARWLPPRLRRPAVGAGLLLILVMLTRTSQLAWQVAPTALPMSLPGL